MSTRPVPATPQQAADFALIEAALAVRAVSHQVYVQLCEALQMQREVRRSKAIDGPIDNGLSIGFARGVTEIHHLIADASTLRSETI